MKQSSARHRSGLFVFACLLVCLSASSIANASVSVLLEQPYGWFSHLSPSGHTAVYFDHICAETPLLLRPCRPGERGVVISRYNGVGDPDWIAVPLLGYLYAVDSPADIPASVTKEEIARLRDSYRRSHLLAVAGNLPDGSTPHNNWYELAGSSYNRTIYGFTVTTTPEQDAEYITFLNNNPNRAHFNAFKRNCADFVRDTMNHFYPGAVRRNIVADLGITSPKSAARSISRFGKKHPEAGFTTFRILQIHGGAPRSHPAMTLMQAVSIELGIPLYFASPYATGVAVTAWLTQGTFREPKHAPILTFGPLTPASVTAAAKPPTPTTEPPLQ